MKVEQEVEPMRAKTQYERVHWRTTAARKKAVRTGKRQRVKGYLSGATGRWLYLTDDAE